MIRAMKPLSGKINIEHHIALWVNKKVAPAAGGEPSKREVFRSLSIQPIVRSDEGIGTANRFVYRSTNAFWDLIAQIPKETKRCTLWLARGWQDALLIGLVKEIEAGHYVRHYSMLDGNKVVFRGLYKGRRVDFTSLGVWTGGAGNEWARAVDDDEILAELIPNDSVREAEERVAFRTVAAILAAGHYFRAGPCRLTMAAQARSWWACALGPILEAVAPASKTSQEETSGKSESFVAPLPWRPLAARYGERQACYGLGTEQYVRGPVPGPVYVVDQAGSYLASLIYTPCPTAFAHTLQKPSIKALAQEVENRTGSALVLIDSPDRPFPVRRRGKAQRAVGLFWTWIAGSELKTALEEKRVLMCECVHLWDTLEPDPARTEELLKLLGKLRECHGGSFKVVLRGLYSTLVGGFASWGRKWERVEMVAPFGRWASWSEISPTTGDIERWRSIAGSVEKLVLSDSQGSSVAQVYADVLARARSYLYDVATIIGWQHVLQIAADSLWLTETGHTRWQQQLAAGCTASHAFHLSTKYDRAWIDGDGRTLAERDGQRFAHVPGIPHETVLTVDGKCVWRIPTPWDGELNPSASRGVRDAVRRYDAGKIIAAAGDFLRTGEPWLQLNDLTVPEELLFVRN